MHIIRHEQGLFIRKHEGTNVTYHIFPEYELHFNVLEPGTVQPWHHHNLIEETLFIISGELEAHWLTADAERATQTLHPGDIARVERTPHTFINASAAPAVFLVVRLILDGQDKRELIKNDKHLDAVE